MQSHGDESRIQEMQHSVLVTSDVRRNGQPLPGDILLEWHVVASNARIAQEIPGAVQESVRHVCLAPSCLAAFRALDEVPLFMSRQRRDTGIVGFEILDERQHNRQIFFRHRHSPTRLTVDDGNRRTPVPLTRDAPVVQAIMNDGLGRPSLRQEFYDRLLRVLDAESIEHA